LTKALVTQRTFMRSMLFVDV